MLLPFILSAKKTYKRKVRGVDGEQTIVTVDGVTKIESAQTFVCHFIVSEYYLGCDHKLSNVK